MWLSKGGEKKVKNIKNKLTLLGVALSLLLSSSSIAYSQPDLTLADLSHPQTGDFIRTLIIPETAVEVAPHVFSLGEAVDVDGQVVQGYAFVHKQENAKPEGAGKAGKGVSKCYSFLARGANWKAVESWLLNPFNSESLTAEYLLTNLGSNISKWEDASDGVIDGADGADILGDGTTTGVVLAADTSSPDGQNEVYFADIGSSGAIAVTIVWGIFGGPPSQRALVEWDQVYDDTDYDWSSSGEAGKMDFENIATHELGHSVGLGHPDDSCAEETMYRFASFGETKKRSLEAGDIKGVSELY